MNNDGRGLLKTSRTDKETKRAVGTQASVAAALLLLLLLLPPPLRSAAEACGTTHDHKQQHSNFWSSIYTSIMP